MKRLVIAIITYTKRKVIENIAVRT